MHVYFFVRLDGLSLGRRRIDRRALVATGAALWLVFLLGRAYGGHQYGWPSRVLEVAGMQWLGSVFLLAACLFLADLACGFGRLFVTRGQRIRSLGVACGVAVVLVAHVQGLRPPVVEAHEVAVDGLPAGLDGTTVAVLTDLHAGEMMVGARWLNARVDQVQALEPDCVVLVGDIIERGADPGELAPVMRRLSAPLGVWAVRGNHDRRRTGRRDVAGEIYAAAGIRPLTNEWVRLAEGLVLAGIDDLTSARRRPGAGEAYLDRALAGSPDEPTILLSHTPWQVDRVAAAGVDLMLSGHTHDGQLWPFNYLVKTRYPFVGGRYRVGDTSLVVSRGTGTWGPRMRLWSPGEISLVTLRISDGKVADRDRRLAGDP